MNKVFKKNKSIQSSQNFTELQFEVKIEGSNITEGRLNKNRKLHQLC